MKSPRRYPALISIAAIAATLFGGFLYAWYAPYSSEIGVLLGEVPLLLSFLVLITLITSITAWATRRTALPARFWMAVLAGAWAGIALAEYFYPPQVRRLSPPPSIEAASQKLCDRFLQKSPWSAGCGPSVAESCESKAMNAPKGMFGWRAPKRWPAWLRLSYRDGAQALVTMRVEASGRYRFARLVISYPRTAPPVWSDRNLATWQPAQWPWQWVVDDSGEVPPVIRRKWECDMTPDCSPASSNAHWRYEVTLPDGRTLAWIARTSPSGYEESLLFLRGDWYFE